MLAIKTRSLPIRAATERHFTLIGSGVTQKQWAKLERPARGKHPSLFGPLESYKGNNFGSVLSEKFFW
jgi:hypothetical protein